MRRGLAGEQAGLREADSSRNGGLLSSWVAVEKRGQASGRARMSVIPDFKASTIIPFLTKNVIPGSTIYTDEPQKPQACRRPALSMRFAPNPAVESCAKV